MIHKSLRRLPGRAKGCSEPVRGQDDRKREPAPGMAWRDWPVENNPQFGAFPAAGTQPSRRIVKGQIGVWTGLIIPAPIWREGKDSLSGMRSHGWRSRGFGP